MCERPSLPSTQFQIPCCGKHISSTRKISILDGWWAEGYSGIENNRKWDKWMEHRGRACLQRWRHAEWSRCVRSLSHIGERSSSSLLQLWGQRERWTSLFLDSNHEKFNPNMCPTIIVRVACYSIIQIVITFPAYRMAKTITKTKTYLRAALILGKIIQWQNGMG